MTTPKTYNVLLMSRKLYVLSTDTYGPKRWHGPEGLVTSAERALQMTHKEVCRVAMIPTCSPIIEWMIEEAPRLKPDLTHRIFGFFWKVRCLVAHRKLRKVYIEKPTMVGLSEKWAVCPKCGTWVSWFW